MRFAAACLVSVLSLTSCGIDVKTPKEMDVKLNVDGRNLVQQLRSQTTDKVPVQYQKFLKAESLKAYLKETGKNIKGECIIPNRNMVRGEQQGDLYVFTLKQKCYVNDLKENKTYRVEFDIMGFINTITLKEEFSFEDHPDATITEVPKAEYDGLKLQGRFIAQ